MPQQSFGYILNQRPFRDSSVLVDIFTQDYGRICCVARPAKKRGKILRGSLQAFRYLHLQWTGKGNVQTLTEADERGRHTIPPSEMMLGIYLNELILLFSHQHHPQTELFSAYKYTLHKLGDTLVNRQILMRFEMYLLANLGYSLEKQDITPGMRYIFTEDKGLIADQGSATQQPVIDADLLFALQDIQSMTESDWKQLRMVLDGIFKQIAPRKINSRRLLNF